MNNKQEQIEQARRLIATGISEDLVAVLYQQFPELKESEDERIRKVLIHIVKGACDKYGIKYKGDDITEEKLLAYLERQKELAVIPDELVKNYKLFCEQGGRELALLINAINGFNKQKEQKTEYEHVDVPGTAEPDYGICDDYIPATLHTAMAKHGWYAGHIREDEKFVLKRKEEVASNWPADKDNLTQDKPAEKHDLVAQLKEHLANTPKGQLEAEWKELEKWNHVGPTVEEYLRSINPAEWSDSVAKEMFIKALERAVEQIKKGCELTDCDKHSWWEDFKAYSGIKPAEWSEEDRHATENCEYAIKETFKDEQNPHRIGTLDWLKSLRPYPKEEREPMEIKYGGKIYQVHGVRDLPGGATGYIIEDEPGHYDCIINPDEVLGGGYGVKQNGSQYPTKEATFDSPHWKPSEEQMEALKLACEDAFDCPEGGVPYIPLKSLLSDLQKQL